MVEKDDVVFDVEFSHSRCQIVAIGFALLPHQIRMRGAENDIDGVRAGLDDFRHRIEHGFDALVRRQEAEGQNDHLPGEVEFFLGVMRFEKRKIGYPVRDDFNLASRHVVNETEQFVAFFRHDDDLGR